MPRVNRFAPVSAAPSQLISVASGYYMISGVLMGAVTLATLAWAPERISHTSPVGTIALVSANFGIAAGMYWVGALLGRQSRRGGYFALGLIILSLLSSFDGFSVAFAALSLGVLASIWRDLK